MECPGRFGQYTLIRRIAVGGMAEIYLAKVGGLAGFQKHLVLKVIHPKFAADPDFVEMLVHEAKLAVRLVHPNIAQVFDLGVQDERYFIAMEYVDGLDVYQFLRRLRDGREPMPFEAAALIIAESCAGLDYAHNRRDEHGRPLGVIHRDISPQNVLLSYEGDVKIIDFGIAKVKASSQSTAAGIIKGKFFYMSPEQARGEDLDQRSDIFSVGALLYELLTLRMLYDTESVHDALRLAKRGAFLPPSTHRPDLPDELDRIALKALARNRKARYQTAGEMRDALTSWLRRAAPGYARHRLEGHVRDICSMNTRVRIARMRRDEFRVQRHQSMIVRGDPADDSGDHADVLTGREPDEATREISPSVRRGDPQPGAETPRSLPNAADALARRIREARANLRWTDEHEVPDLDLEDDAETRDVLGRSTTRTEVRTDELGNDDPTRPAPSTPQPRASVAQRPSALTWPDEDDDPTTRDPRLPPLGGPSHPPTVPVDHYPAPSVLEAEDDPLGDITDIDETVVDPGPLRRALEEAEAVMSLDEPVAAAVDPLVEGTTNPYRPGSRRSARAQPPADRPPRRPAEPVGAARPLSPPKRRPARPSSSPPTRAAGRRPDEAEVPTIQRPEDSDEDFRDKTWPEPISGAPVESSTTRRGLLVFVAVVVLAIGAAVGALLGPNAVQPVPDGSLFITSRPRLGAHIYLDGVPTEFMTPAVIHQLAGNSSHDIRVVLTGFEPAAANNVVVEPGDETEVVLYLEPAEFSATIESVPAGAEVIVDDRVVGRTPTTLRDLAVGADGGTTVLLRLPGHVDSVFTLQWSEGETHVLRRQSLTPTD